MSINLTVITPNCWVFFSLEFDACQSQAPSILKINDGANSKLIGKISSKFKFLFFIISALTSAYYLSLRNIKEVKLSMTSFPAMSIVTILLKIHFLDLGNSTSNTGSKPYFAEQRCVIIHHQSTRATTKTSRANYETASTRRRGGICNINESMGMVYSKIKRCASKGHETSLLNWRWSTVSK